MPKEIEQQFISAVLSSPPSQLIENLASESHETKRFPDPYIYIVKNNKLTTPNGKPVENEVERQTHIGRLEFTALREIQHWASSNKEGVSVWFSPPFEDRYPVSKIIISELSSSNDTKILFNRAIVLDDDANTLLHRANNLSKSFYSNSSEVLRATPIFPNSNELSAWLSTLSVNTNQVNMVSTGQDIHQKTDTYSRLNVLSRSITITGENRFYADLYKSAKLKGFIGQHQGSCPTLNLTSFETLFQQSMLVGENKTLDCTCPMCSKKVTAIIENGRIHCPSCNKSAAYAC